MANRDGQEAETKRRKVESGTEPCIAESGAQASCQQVPGKSAACLRMREKILAVERDYTHYFALDVGGEPGADQYVYQHFNTLCVVGIAPSSVAFSGGRKVSQVDFDVGRGGDKSDAPKPSGKKKKGAMYLILLSWVLFARLSAVKAVSKHAEKSVCVCVCVCPVRLSCGATCADFYQSRRDCATLFATMEHASKSGVLCKATSSK